MSTNARSLLVASLLAACAAGASVVAQEKQKPVVKVPEAGVPQIATIEGMYVRAAYNNEGYVIIGYRTANESRGEEWMLLEMGATVREKTQPYKLTRDALSLETPDGKTIPLPTVPEFREANTVALQNLARVKRDSIDYFPPNARTSCRIGFFSDLGSSAKAWDTVEFTDQQACVGRLYFPVPGGITYGQHWLNVKFANSLVRVPFKILTKEEYEVLDKHYKDIEKQVKDAFKKPKKN